MIVNPRTHEVHLLNATATRVWELLETARSLEELIGVLADEYESLPSRLGPDVVAVVADFAAKGIIGPWAGRDQT